jgi:sugar lactone lactonase YvrE
LSSKQITWVLLLFGVFPLCGFAQSELITTIAGTGETEISGSSGFGPAFSLVQPVGISVDATGNVYFSDKARYRVFKLTPSGVVSVYAGTGLPGFSGDGGSATGAQLLDPDGTAIDALNNLYIADKVGNRVRRVNADGIIQTVAGTGSTGFSGDGGLATRARLNAPEAVAVDAAGNLYIADRENQRIRKVDTDGVITTVAGTGDPGFSGDGGPATQAKLNSPQGVAVDLAGNLYIADHYNNRIRRVNKSGIISTVAGNGTFGFSGDGGYATSAQLAYPQSVAVDAAGNLFVADYYNNRIRKVDTKGIITTIVGSDKCWYSGDGGSAESAQICDPLDVSVDEDGNLYFSDFTNVRIRKIHGPAAFTSYFPQVAIGGGYTTQFSMTNSGSSPATATLNLTDPKGAPFVVEGVVVSPDGKTTTLTGSSFSVLLPSGGVGFITVKPLHPDDPIGVAWARLVSSIGSLSAVATYELTVEEAIQTMVGVLQTKRLPYATIPLDNDELDKKQMGYVIANPSGQEITIKMALVDRDGTVLEDNATLKLGPREYFGGYLYQEFDAADLKGSFVMRGKGGATFVVMALLDKKGILTALPVVPGKFPGVSN